jgi:hypothetical protein
MGERSYQLERNVLTAMSFDEADDHVRFWEDKSMNERLNAACFIINQIFNVTPSSKIDMRFTDKRKHNG